MKERSDIAVIGLGVMGSGIARNLESKGYTVSVYNRSPEKTAAFMEQYGNGISGARRARRSCAGSWKRRARSF